MVRCGAVLPLMRCIGLALFDALAEEGSSGWVDDLMGHSRTVVCRRGKQDWIRSERRWVMMNGREGSTNTRSGVVSCVEG